MSWFSSRYDPIMETTEQFLYETSKKKHLTFEFSVGRHQDLQAIDQLVSHAIRQPDFTAISLTRAKISTPGGALRVGDTLALDIHFEKR